MKLLLLTTVALAVLGPAVLPLAEPVVLFRHCDGMDGPVVKAAQRALETGNANHVLIWVPRQGETEIVAAFQKTLAVRKAGPEARELADRFFFETVVRIHRAGEGEPFTGLKPTGTDFGIAVTASDKALADGAVDPVVKLVTNAAAEGIQEQFRRVTASRNFKVDDLDAGREYVAKYVEYVHYVKRLYDAAKGPTADHSGGEPGGACGHPQHQ
jgi:hypothetical protein